MESLVSEKDGEGHEETNSSFLHVVINMSGMLIGKSISLYHIYTTYMTQKISLIWILRHVWCTTLDDIVHLFLFINHFQSSKQYISFYLYKRCREPTFLFLYVVQQLYITCNRYQFLVCTPRHVQCTTLSMDNTTQFSRLDLMLNSWSSLISFRSGTTLNSLCFGKWRMGFYISTCRNWSGVCLQFLSGWEMFTRELQIKRL